MNIKDIKIGTIYLINYVDTSYPCNCECHTNNNILHCVPCCCDRSYHGLAKCTIVDLESGIVHLKPVDNTTEFGKRWAMYPENVYEQKGKGLESL